MFRISNVFNTNDKQNKRHGTKEKQKKNVHKFTQNIIISMTEKFFPPAYENRLFEVDVCTYLSCLQCIRLHLHLPNEKHTLEEKILSIWTSKTIALSALKLQKKENNEK